MNKSIKPGWSYKKLNELGFVGRGKSKHRPRNEPSLYGGKHPFIQTAEVTASEFYIIKYSQTYSDLGLAQSKLWDKNTLCIVNAGENTAETAILKFQACFPDSIIGFIADSEKADVRFIKYYLTTIKPQLRSITKGATQDNLSVSKLLLFDILTPPLPIQRKIAGILSAYDRLIAEVKTAVEEILDRSIGTSNYIIPASNQQINLSQIDFEALKSKLASGYKHTETEKLKGIISSQLTQMLRLNKSRMNYLDKFQQMIDEYNAGSCNVETLFAELVEFARELKIEDKRAICENLSEEELAIFDLLTKPDITLTEKEKLEVKKVAQELLETLKREKLVLDWRRRQQTKAAVKVAIEQILDRLPESYLTEVYQRKCQEIYQHVYESYSEAGRSIYTTAA